MIFLGVLFDCLTWRNHIELIENKISKNLGVLYKTKYLLSQKCMINIYFSFIHSYINYANIAWSSTNRSKLSKLFNKQKHASRIILFQDRHVPAKLLMTRLKTLNIFQLNIYQILLFMFKIKHNQNPDIFNNQFSDIHHKYSTRFSSYNFLQPKKYSNSTYYSIANRGPLLWNSFLDDQEKTITSYHLFKKTAKDKLLACENDYIYF